MAVKIFLNKKEIASFSMEETLEQLLVPAGTFIKTATQERMASKPNETWAYISGPDHVLNKYKLKEVYNLDVEIQNFNREGVLFDTINMQLKNCILTSIYQDNHIIDLKFYVGEATQVSMPKTTTITFNLLEYNPRRAFRGKEAAKVQILEDGKFIKNLWMSKKDLQENIKEYGECDALLRGLFYYTNNQEYHR